MTPGGDAEAAEPLRPFWSVMIPAYNSTKFLGKTLESVLAQDPGPEAMQIEVVDGYSTMDLPEPVVKQIAGDRVSVFRHPQPVSMAGNWNSCIDRARGQWVHILHTDDVVLPGFYAQLRQSLEHNPEVGAAFTRWTKIDEDGRTLEVSALESQTPGILPDGLERIAAAQIIQFPAMVVRKRAYQAVGGFRDDLSYALDWEMWVRIASRYPVWYEPEPLACYRVHTNSETARLRQLGEDLSDQAKAIPIMVRYLPPRARAREELALRLLDIAKGLFVVRQPRGSGRCIVSALRLAPSPRVLASSLQLAWWTLVGTVRVAARGAGLIPYGPGR